MYSQLLDVKSGLDNHGGDDLFREFDVMIGTIVFFGNEEMWRESERLKVLKVLAK